MRARRASGAPGLMLFQSQIYVLLFLPLTVALYYAAARSPVLRHWVLIVASLVFYGWWDPRFIILVVAQISATWLLTLMHAQTGARAWLALGIVLNLASLGHSNISTFSCPRSSSRAASRSPARI